MAAAKLWKRYCENFKYYPELGLSLDISRMNFNDGYWAKIFTKCKQAFLEMDELEKGNIANPDENRMVGHYWLRNSELAPNCELKNEIDQALVEVKTFAANILSGAIKSPTGEKFKNVIYLGIGGSALGPQFIAESLRPQKPELRFFFIDNTDPDGIALTLNDLEQELARTLVVVVSKSGGTVETRNGMIEVAMAYQRRNLDFSKHAVAITSLSSKLCKIAEAGGWIKILPMWDWVGGRTSVMSPVGTLVVALLGIKLDEFLAGAKAVDIVTREHNMRTNPAMVLATMWYYAGNGKGEKDLVVLPYKDRLLLLSRYLQQLIMESLGKEFNKEGKVVNQGLAVYGNKGSTDQHAYVQQLREGVKNFFVLFVEVLEDKVELTNNTEKAVEVEAHVTSGDYLQGFMLGTRLALFEKGRESIILTLDKLNEFSVGGLIALFERAVGFYASLVNINAYHQPGVEAGKKAAGMVVEMEKILLKFFDNYDVSSKALSVEQIASEINCQKEDDFETLYKVLEHLVANGRGIERERDERKPDLVKYKRSR
ncbi:MAG: glucose-6-phosphate isomerase [Deltaproteobacteria bacterium]|jgi:glucose-6-phosphate isomerase|nr:glucose-6-phosphate isomerase [Deltaproteobacteria bacterium]